MAINIGIPSTRRPKRGGETGTLRAAAGRALQGALARAFASTFCGWNAVSVLGDESVIVVRVVARSAQQGALNVMWLISPIPVEVSEAELANMPRPSPPARSYAQRLRVPGYKVHETAPIVTDPGMFPPAEETIPNLPRLFLSALQPKMSSARSSMTRLPTGNRFCRVWRDWTTDRLIGQAFYFTLS